MKNQSTGSTKKSKNTDQQMNYGTFVAHADAKINLKPAIGLKPNKLERISEILNKTLANQHVLYIKTRNYHWNLIGKRFHTLHVFLEEQYKTLAMWIDETAERARVLGGVPRIGKTKAL